MRIHGGERTHKCNQCNKSFIDKARLTQHTKRMHSVQRLYKCDLCYKAFKTTTEFRLHKLTHPHKQFKTFEYLTAISLS